MSKYLLCFSTYFVLGEHEGEEMGRQSLTVTTWRTWPIVGGAASGNRVDTKQTRQVRDQGVRRRKTGNIAHCTLTVLYELLESQPPIPHLKHGGTARAGTVISLCGGGGGLIDLDAPEPTTSAFSQERVQECGLLFLCWCLMCPCASKT